MSNIVSYDTLKDSQRLEVPKKPIPARWRPPSSPFPRVIFHVMCFGLTFHSNLDFMWEIFQEPNGWENFHTLYLTQINQLSTVQGLLLTTVAVFISTPSPLKQIDYSADGPYTLLSESLVFSLFGLLLQLFTSVVGQTYQKQKNLQSFEAKSVAIPMPYHRSLNSGLSLRHISTAAHLCHICDGLPVLFNFSSDFYWSNIRGAFYVSVCFCPTVAVLFATS
ncbi:hypothetical protein DFJ58DRAFT_144832 [Suillus subalutaceus]|uniref:uncharacterized protein n=1 Tax=Suillus subalutaceus TaxID=48586 RepID=UPI001B8771B1|nr:uncharacterized protein DFJ58DRAFT_144832 [Suillus subalutaceus]KAG1837576.1 hypothetical protein DFJ58DRAFT_144832 [Suillus subalutaceus]